MRSHLILLAWIVAAGCGEAKVVDSGKQTEGDADTDTDTDADADADSDADADTDTGYSPFDFVGTLDYQEQLIEERPDGTQVQTICEAEIELTGEHWPGFCADCDFVLEVTGVVVADNSHPDCVMWPLGSYIEDTDFYGYDRELLLAHVPVYGDATDLLKTGFAYGGGAPEWMTIAGTDLPAETDFGDLIIDGDDLEWDVELEEVEQAGENAHYDDCSTIVFQDTAPGGYGGTPQPEDVACDGTKVDLWAFDGADGFQAAITVDTPVAGAEFDPLMWINDDNSCTLIEADDNHGCSYPPSSGGCPSTVFDTEDMTYEIVVQSKGSCTDPQGGLYRIMVERSDGMDPMLSLTDDDAPLLDGTDTWVITLQGEGTLLNP